MSFSSLADHSLASLSARLQDYGSSLQGESRDAISALLQVLEEGLKGNLGPGYFLSAIDPGIGKTLSVSTFLGTWKDQTYTPSTSVLIGLSRLEEIETYLHSSGLTKEDVAVLTSDRDRNALGVPEDQHGNARVMFTTQQMIERRTRGRSFAEASEFHYKGKPRTLRIWDESFIPAEHLTLRADDLAKLPAALRRQHPKYISLVQGLISRLWSAKGGEKVAVPPELAESLGPGRTLKDPQLREIVETLERLAGREAAVVDLDQGGLCLAGASSPLPSDFAPVIILDASGRVRSTYSAWEAAGAQLTRLPAAVKDYRNLTVNLWERAVGKIAFQDPAARDEVMEAVAEVILADLQGSWLIVSYKEPSIEEALRKALPDEPKGGLHFLTWGMHHGTNAYAHCRNVVLIGQMTYGPAGYPALAAALGVQQEANAAEALLRDGEYSHHWLQALSRAHVRHNQDGLAGTCRAYVIASPGLKTGELLQQTFPGCDVEAWSPNLTKVNGHAGTLIALLEQARAKGRLPVTKKALREALGVQPPNFSRLLDHPVVRTYLEQLHLRVNRNEIGNFTKFEPWPGDGFTFADLEDIE